MLLAVVIFSLTSCLGLRIYLWVRLLGVGIITANGPAIKGVSVAVRVEAGAVSPNQGNVPAPAGRSEAWRGFCRQVACFLSFTSVTIQGLLGAGHLSPYTGLVESSGAVTVISPYTVILLTAGMICKNRDTCPAFCEKSGKLITFIVRVRYS